MEWLHHEDCYASNTPTWEGFALKSLVFMSLLKILMAWLHVELNLLGPKETQLMDRPSLLISTPKDRLLGKGLSRVSPCMSLTPLAWRGIEAMEQKGFTTSLVFGLTISKETWGLLLLVALSSDVSLSWRLFSLPFLCLIIRGLGGGRGVNVRLYPFCLSEYALTCHHISHGYQKTIVYQVISDMHP